MGTLIRLLAIGFCAAFWFVVITFLGPVIAEHIRIVLASCQGSMPSLIDRLARGER